MVAEKQALEVKQTNQGDKYVPTADTRTVNNIDKMFDVESRMSVTCPWPTPTMPVRPRFGLPGSSRTRTRCWTSRSSRTALAVPCRPAEGVVLLVRFP